MQIIQSLQSRLIRLPVTSAVDLVKGTLMIRGTTAETNLGTVIVGATDSAAGTYVGILAELHDNSAMGSALVAGAEHSAVITGAAGAAWFAPQGGDPEIFPSRQIEVLEGLTLCKIQYKLTGIAATSSSGTTVTIASLEDNIDTAFVYAASGGAIGKLRFVDTSGSGSCTTAVSFGAGDAVGTGKIVKVVPLLHGLVLLTVGNTTTATQIDTAGAVGAARLVQLERHILRNGIDENLDPFTHGNLSGLNSLSQFNLYGIFSIASSVFQPLA